MLSDVYLAAALAIFLAVFGWSESIFGLSQRTKEKEAEFLAKTGLSKEKYSELRSLVSRSKNADAGKYVKEVMTILKGTNLITGAKIVFDKINQNEKKLAEWEHHNKTKKTFFTILFVFLFIVGTILLVVESSPSFNENVQITFVNMSLYNLLVVLFQSALFCVLVYGSFIYKRVSECGFASKVI